jgi:prepilin-type N-terminal cleavage/methylation domain-containing protein
MKKGFSIIELLIVISIISIFSLASFFSMSNYNRFSSEVDMLFSEDMMLAVINDGKQYCREKEKPGYVLFDMSRNEVNFFSSSKKIEGFKLPKGVTIHSINTNQYKVDIDKFGVTSDAGTIMLKDKAGRSYTMTISVGTGYAEIK